MNMLAKPKHKMNNDLRQKQGADAITGNLGNDKASAYGSTLVFLGVYLG